MVRNRWCSTRLKIACMCKRAFWPGASTRWDSSQPFAIVPPPYFPSPTRGRVCGACGGVASNWPLSLRIFRPQISAMTSNSPDIKLKETPVRAPSHVPVDDAVLPFEVASLDLRGRLTRLGPGLDDLLAKHDYPPPVAKLLGEAIVLTTLLGSSLKFNGRFILQTQTDGPVSFLIVDFQAPDRLRAYARFDAREIKEGQDSGSLLGKGHLAR